MSLVILCTFIFILFLLFYYHQRRPTNFPPGPQWYPFVGNSIQLRQSAKKLGGTHLVYKEWAKEFNNPHVLGFRLGRQLFIIGLSEKAVSEIHLRSVFSGRPRNIWTFIRTLNTYAGITFTDGTLWKVHRAFVQKHLKIMGFGSAPMQKLIERELVTFKELIDNQMKQVGYLWPGEFLSESVMNVLWNLVAGDDKEHRILSKTLVKSLAQRSKSFDVSGGIMTDFPWLRFIAPVYTGYSLLCRINNEIRSILQKIINDHHKHFTEAKANEDLIYAFIKEMKDQAGEDNSTFSDTQLMVIMMDFLLGGNYTISATFDLALMTLVLYEDIQEEIYQEIDKAYKNCKNISHYGELPFTQAYLMEIARFYTLAPISGPRRTLEDTELCGYSIPKNTTVLIGIESVHMDRTLWGDPEVFRPSRFLNDTQTQLIPGKHLLQFGLGKRMCIGIPLAKAFLHTFFTGIVHQYKLSLVPGEARPNQNLKAGLFKRIEPYKVFFSKRT